MIITLKGANFSGNHIDTDSYRITPYVDGGSSYSGPTSVIKEASYTGTVTIKDGFELNGDVTVTMGGSSVTPSINGKTITISIGSVTGPVVIRVTTKATSSTPTTPTTYTVTYQINGHGTQPAAVNGVTTLPNPLPTLTASGWTFGGWYTNSACTTAAVAGGAISANTTLYAKWTEVTTDPEEPGVDPSTCSHTFGTGNICTICGMPNYTKVTIVKNEGIKSITVTKTSGWGTTGQTIADGTNVHIGDRLQVDVVPEDGYTLVGVESPYTTTAFSGGCTISPTATIIEDVTYELVTPVDTTTGLQYYMTTAAANSGPYSTWKYYVYDVTPGRKYHIKALSGQAARMWIMFKDAELVKENVINYSSDSSAAAIKEEYVVAPEGAVKMVVNTRTDDKTLPIVEVHPTYGV